MNPERVIAGLDIGSAKTTVVIAEAVGDLHRQTTLKILGVGQARTKVGRFLSDLCNALTGGVSVFGVMSLCARGTEEPYSASPLRPL